MNIKTTKMLMRQHGLTFKKSLGQNFLTDQNILRNIVQAARLNPSKGVIEIGSGIGALTQHLADEAGKVVAIEIDRRFMPVLQEQFAAQGHVVFENQDVLKMNLHILIATHFKEVSALSVVANLPYYATTPIIMKLLEEKLPLEYIVVMVQKEVAERMKAKPGSKDYGSLSIAVQYYCETEWVCNVPHTVFIPPPQVDSAVIRLTVRKQSPVDVKDEVVFFQVVRASFAQRRKTIFNNLMFAFFRKGQKEALTAILEGCGIDPTRRGETLSMEEYAKLSNALLDARVL